MLPTLSAFYEAHDIEPDKRIAMIISMKNHLHMFADEILLFSKSAWHQIYMALAGSPFTVKVEGVPETV